MNIMTIMNRLKITQCPSCGENTLYENTMATAAYYNLKARHLLNKDGEYDASDIPNIIIMKCDSCGHEVEMDLESYFYIKKAASVDVMLQLRFEEAATTLDKSGGLREESGFSYCGLCPGLFDGDGYCNNDVMAVCKVRRRLLG